MFSNTENSYLYLTFLFINEIYVGDKFYHNLYAEISTVLHIKEYARFHLTE